MLPGGRGGVTSTQQHSEHHLPLPVRALKLPGEPAAAAEQRQGQPGPTLPAVEGVAWRQLLEAEWQPGEGVSAAASTSPAEVESTPFTAKHRRVGEEHLFTAPETVPWARSPRGNQDCSGGFLQVLLPGGKK